MPLLPWRNDSDGFAFANSWTLDAAETAALAALVQPAIAGAVGAIGAIIPDPILLTALTIGANAAIGVLGPSIVYGLCGGMAYASLDYWHTRTQLPRGAHRNDQPMRATAVGAAVRGMIWGRLINSLVQGDALRRTLEWSLLLNQVPGALGGGAGELLRRTRLEWDRIKNIIDSGQPWPIGLVYTGRVVWDQHQIHAYGYDDFGNGTGRLYVYDSNRPHQYGDTDHDFVTLDFTGSSLVATSPSDGPDTLAGFFCTNYTMATPPAGLATSFGQFLSWSGSAQSWLTAYGARMPIADATELAALGGTATDVRPTTMVSPSGSVRPRDGALLRERSAAPVFLYQGGSPFWVPDETWLDRFGGWGAVRNVPDGTLSAFVGPPDEGTLLREWSAAEVYRMMSGQRRWVNNPTELAKYGGFPTVRVVPDGALAAIPIGQPLLTLPTGPAAHGDDMQPGEVLAIDQPINSPNGWYTFVFQGDGNLVLYKNYRDRDRGVLWASGTGDPVGVCILQGDGNLVIYSADVTPIWASNTAQHAGSRLVVQDDGNVVIYRPDGTPVWATNTPQRVLPGGPAAHGDDMQPGEVLAIDQPISSPNGRYAFVFQGDGNLVLYENHPGRDREALWASGTGGPIGVCIMQGDGNLVIYNADATPIWASNTWQYPGSRLVVQDDGNVVIYRPDGTPVWATDTMRRVLPSGPVAHGDDMQPGEILAIDQSINSPSGWYTFVFQGDGNLVLYKNYRDRDRGVLWASGTGAPVGICILQGDGNLVIYSADVTPIWASNTAQYPGSRLVVQDDGNVVIYRPDGTPVWATNTPQRVLPGGPAAHGDDMQPGEVLAIDQPISSPNGRYAFVFQGDGNLVLYKNHPGRDREALWASGTGGPIGVCILQGDGNLVVYNADVAPIWASNTAQFPGSRLVVQDDGNVVIYRPDGTPVWATNTT